MSALPPPEMSAAPVRSPLTVYDELLRGDERIAPVVRRFDGTTRQALVERWRGHADAADEHALAHLRGPVLDLGCGPGRHLHALARRGVFGLGVDLSPVAVGLARGRGVQAIVGSIFDELPQTGRWGAALLLDGNIGIGGSPRRLLRRVRGLLRDDGEILVELEPPGCPTTQTRVRLESAGVVSDWFAWAEVSADDAEPFAREAGLMVQRAWERDGRWFALLRAA